MCSVNKEWAVKLLNTGFDRPADISNIYKLITFEFKRTGAL